VGIFNKHIAIGKQKALGEEVNKFRRRFCGEYYTPGDKWDDTEYLRVLFRKK
jgi:hypothetical protein